jgi:hypothetical protein
MSDIPSINSDQGTTPTPANEDHTKVTTSSSQDTIVSSDSTQVEQDASSQDNEIPAMAQKIIDAFMQSDILDLEKSGTDKSIPTVCSSQGSSNDSTGSGSSGSSSETTQEPGYAQSTSSSTSTDEESEGGLTSTEQKILDAGLNSSVLSDSQKAQIEENPDDFVTLVEKEAKHAKENKKEEEERSDQMAEYAKGDAYNPDVAPAQQNTDKLTD